MENILDYVDCFISLDLNVIQNIINLDLIQEYCNNSRNGTTWLHLAVWVELY